MPTLVIQPDPAAGFDCWLNSVSADNNYGTSLILNTLDAANRSLLRFDVSPIPAGSSIVAAGLYLECSAVGTIDGVTIRIHRGLVAFFEGLQNGATPGAGENGSTYNNRNHNGPVAWGAAGGLADTDYLAAHSSQGVVGDVGPYTFIGLAGDVQLWLDTPAINHGWWVLQFGGTGNAKTFHSSDGLTPALRPRLTIEYIEELLPGGGDTTQKTGLPLIMTLLPLWPYPAG